MAARQTGFDNQSSQYPTVYPSHSQHSSQSDFKAPYDDLIDEYSVPYGSKPGFNTYSIEAPVGDHRRRHSQTLGHKPSQSTKISDDASDASHFDYPPAPPAKEVDGRSIWEKLLPESMACRLYVLVVLLETAIDVAIESELLLRVHRQTEQVHQASSKNAAYLSIFALAHVFQLVLAVDAVYARNVLQFIFLTIFNALFLVYAVIQITELKADTPGTEGVSSIPINVLTTIIPIVISIAEVAYIGLGWKIYNEFGWKVYKFLGADRQIKKMYASYQIFECLVKFDVFFWVGFSVRFIWLVLNKEDWEYYVTCAALPLSIVLLIEGHLAARHENKWMMATFMSGCVSALVYFIYKLAKVWVNRQSTSFAPIYQTLTVFSVISIGLLITTFAFSIIVMRNFGRGLKGALEKKSQMKGSSKPHNRAASVNLNRMSIN